MPTHFRSLMSYDRLVSYLQTHSLWGEIMEQGKKIAIIGGDARYLPLIHALNERDYIDIVILGFDKVEQSYTAVKQTTLDRLQIDDLSAVVLPITGIDENGKIETMFSTHTIQLTEDWFLNLPNDCIVFTGIANQLLKDYCKKAGLQLIELMSRDDVAIYNSIPTAEGTIMLAIQNTDITIHHSNVFVFGFGRVGETTANSFHGLGANITVVSRDRKELARAFERGYETLLLDNVNDQVTNCDILINTIPHPVIGEEILQYLNNQALIIDLASKPGGVDFEYAKARAIEAIHALGLPGMVAPKTAGVIIAGCIADLIQ